MEALREEVKSYWEVASITHFCYLFRKKLKLPSFDFEDLEEALIQPVNGGDDTCRWLLDKIIIALVKGYYCRNSSINESNYDKFFRKLMKKEWVQNDKQKNPLTKITLDEKGEEIIERVDFHSLPMRTKAQLLHKLCDYRLCAPDSSSFVKEAAGRLRHKAIGIDSLGYVYWYFHGSRLYKEKPRVAKILVEKLREPMKPVNGATVKAEKKHLTLSKSPEKTKLTVNGKLTAMAPGLKNQTSLWNWLKETQARPQPETTTGVPVSILKESWSVACHNSEEWKKLIERLKASSSLADRELGERFKLTYLPKVKEAEEQKKKELMQRDRQRIRELMPRRCSSRIADKMAVLESNMIEKKLRSRADRAKMRQLYAESSDESETDQGKEDPDPNYKESDTDDEVENLKNTEKLKVKPTSQNPTRQSARIRINNSEESNDSSSGHCVNLSQKVESTNHSPTRCSTRNRINNSEESNDSSSIDSESLSQKDEPCIKKTNQRPTTRSLKKTILEDIPELDSNPSSSPKKLRSSRN